jgi:glycerol-3-phosphate dehydrogenase
MQPSSSNDLRPEVRQVMKMRSPEVLIIGGGINGLATLRDLALQGVSAVLVDRGDFCSGASAASSHMIHGGIRYLENGEFRLVHESVVERNDLLVTAPHCVSPLLTTVPLFSLWSGIVQAPLRMLTHKKSSNTERGAALIAVGLLIYESFSRRAAKRMPRMRFSGRKKARALLPSLHPGVKYVASYFDASSPDPERLALDVLDDALSHPTVVAVNYVEAVRSEGENVILRDGLTGVTFALRPRIVVNMTGPWVDVTNTSLGVPTQFMGGTKGSHIVVDHPGLEKELAGRELFFENSDGRIVLIYPLKGKVMIGTTDIPHDPSTPAVCTGEEMDYFFDLVKHVLPGVDLCRSDVVFHFSGVRPLPKTDAAQPGFISRDYRIEHHTLGGGQGPDLLSVVGGKWTTFRALAETVSDRVCQALGYTRAISTRFLPIGGGVGFPATDEEESCWCSQFGGPLSETRKRELLKRYGTFASRLIEATIENGECTLTTTPDYSVQEVEYLITQSQAVHVVDVMLRRTSLAISGRVTDEVLDEWAGVMGNVLSWSEARRSQERTDAARILRDTHGVAVTVSDQKAATTAAARRRETVSPAR